MPIRNSGLPDLGAAGLCLALAASSFARPSEAASGPRDARGDFGAIAFQRLVIPAEVPAHLASALAQDGRAFLWIGTQGGLVRWDGLQFRVFASDPADPETLGGNYVRTLLAARDGRVWAGTFGGGLSVFDPESERFRRYRRDAQQPNSPQSLAHDRVEGLAEDAEGSIWIATSGGLDRLRPATGEIEHFHHDSSDASSLADDSVRGLLVDSTGRLWVGSRGGLQRRRSDGAFERAAAVLDPASGALTRFPAAGDAPRSVSQRWIYGFAESGTESSPRSSAPRSPATVSSSATARASRARSRSVSRRFLSVALRRARSPGSRSST